MADSRIYELPDYVDTTDFYFICDTGANTSAVKVPFSYVQNQFDTINSDLDTFEDLIDDNSQAIEDLETAVEALPVVVYAARIYETTNNVTNSFNKTEHVNDNDLNPLFNIAGFVKQINTAGSIFELYLGNFNQSGLDFDGTYTVQITVNPVDLSDARLGTYKYEYNTTIGRGILYITLNDTASADKLEPFSIEIRKWN